MANTLESVSLVVGESDSMQEDLQFQDIAHDDHGLGDSPDEMSGAKSQTHTFTNFPEPAGSDDDAQADLLRGEKKQTSFWTFEYYQSYFDVDSYQVLYRILGSMFPNPKRNFLQQQIRPNPDLYGPFWVCTTLVFTTAIAGNLANYIQHSQDSYTWQYDFHKVSFAATAIYGYWWLMPTLLYALLWWRGTYSSFAFSEMICVYGYSLAVYIPISILWVIQVSWLQWLLVMLGMALSGSVLVLTFWPAVKQDHNQKISFLITILIIVFHGLLAIGFVMYFFHVPDVTTTVSPASNTTTPVVPLDQGQNQSNILPVNLPQLAGNNPGMPPPEKIPATVPSAPGT